ncbi:MAG: hypothetical protein Q8J64_06085 [Thermodesulfovibrionales bacterium]|nr:hypothetical protein [Thermodesulfovibrionales bacterium]
MGKVAFIDYKEGEGSVYIIDKGSGGSETVPLSLSGDGSFGTNRTFQNIDETYLSLPMGLLNFRILELPFDNMDSIREVLPFELDGIIIGGSESVVIDAVVIGKGNGKFRVIAVYVLKDVLRTALKKFKAIGIDPRAVTSIELASVVGSSSAGDGLAEALLAPCRMEDGERMDAALKEIAGPFINLRRGEFSYRVDTEKARKSLMIAAGLGLLIVSVFIFGTGFRIITAKKEITTLKDGIRKTYTGVFPEEKKITNELYQMKAHMKELKEKEQSLTGVSPLELLLKLSKVVKPGLSFTEISADKERIALKGECPTLSDVQGIKDGLEGFLAGVSISDAKPSGAKTAFTITAKGRKD